MHPFPLQDIASLRIQEFRAAAERASLVSQAKAARRGSGRRPAPSRVRRDIGWWLVGAGLRLALDPDAPLPVGRGGPTRGMTPLCTSTADAAWPDREPLLATRARPVER